MAEHHSLSIIALCGISFKDKIEAAVQKAEGFEFLGSCESSREATARLGIKPADLVIAELSSRNQTEFDKLTAYLREKGIPFIAVCEDASNGFYGLNAGAKNMVVLRSYDSQSVKFFISTLSNVIKQATKGRGESRVLKHSFTEPVSRIIAIGASTGGAEAVLQIMKGMPDNAPPIVVVMHMPSVFTRIFAERVNSLCKITAWEAEDGDRLRQGLVLIAKGDKHIALNKDKDGYFVTLRDGEPIGGHCPSINHFFESAAKTAKSAAVGVILTGMGADGADGITLMRNAGAFTIGQDQASSVVYGMPRVAFEKGGVSVQAPLDEIAKKILEAV